MESSCASVWWLFVPPPRAGSREGLAGLSCALGFPSVVALGHPGLVGEAGRGCVQLPWAWRSVSIPLPLSFPSTPEGTDPSHWLCPPCAFTMLLSPPSDCTPVSLYWEWGGLLAGRETRRLGLGGSVFSSIRAGLHHTRLPVRRRMLAGGLAQTPARVIPWRSLFLGGHPQRATRSSKGFMSITSWDL